MGKVLTGEGVVLLGQVRVARGFWAKFCGLMGKRSLGKRAALLLTNCNSVHCCFMRFPIDVVFLSASGQILRIIPNLRPWRFSPIVRRATMVLECRAGVTQLLGIKQGDALSIDVSLDS